MYHISNRHTFQKDSSMYIDSEIFYEERDYHILNFGPSYTVTVHKAALKC